MLYGFFGRVTSSPQMRDALDASSQRVKAIAQRVSAATTQKQSGFALPDVTMAPPESVNLEAEMTSLADETLRYETTAKLLAKTYQKIRLSLKTQ